MEIFVYVLVVAVATASGIIAYMLMDRPRRAVATPSAATTADPSLGERVNALEREFPAWRIAMSQLADQATEMLEESESLRRRARTHQTNAEAARRRAAGGTEGETQEPLGQPGLPGQGAQPLDPGQHRAAILAFVRNRRGAR